MLPRVAAILDLELRLGEVPPSFPVRIWLQEEIHDSGNPEIQISQFCLTISESSAS